MKDKMVSHGYAKSISAGDCVASSRESVTEWRSIAILGAFYIAMHGWIFFLPHAVYWDGWALYRNSSAAILDMFRQIGTMFNMVGYLHVALLHAGIWAYRYLTFVLMFAAGILLNSILRRNEALSDERRFFVVLLFLVLPFNMARITIVDFPYTLAYFLFFLGWWLLGQSRWASLLCFFLSFTTNSLLVFYLFPMLDALFREGGRLTIRSMIAFIWRRLDFMLLPFIFYFIQIMFFKPFGMYAGYHQHYSLTGVPAYVLEQIRDIKNALPDSSLMLFSVVFTISLLMARSAVGRGCIVGRKFGAYLSRRIVFGVGLLATVAGILPYWVVGNVPLFTDWDSRNQLLMPFGASLILVSLLFSIGRAWRYLGLIAVVSSSLAYGAGIYASLARDWDKQMQIVKFLAESPAISKASLVIVRDDSECINALGRKYRFYEWNALLEMAYGRQDHFALPPDEFAYYEKGGYDRLFLPQYKAGMHHRKPDEAAVLLRIQTPECSAASERSWWPPVDFSPPDLKFSISMVSPANSLAFSEALREGK